jgi:hypothetical protein
VSTPPNIFSYPEGNFEELDLAIQRALIIKAVKFNTITLVYDDKRYELPQYLQVTYKCHKCNDLRPMRAFRRDVIAEKVAQTLYCKECRERSLRVFNITASLDYSLDKIRKEKRLLAYFDKALQPSRDGEEWNA